MSDCRLRYLGIGKIFYSCGQGDSALAQLVTECLVNFLVGCPIFVNCDISLAVL